MSIEKKQFYAIAVATLLASLPAQAQRFDEIQVTNEAPLKSFESVYIAPVKIALEPEYLNQRPTIRTTEAHRNPDSILSEQDKTLNAAQLFEDLERAFGKKFVLATAPGEGVLTVDATITKLKSTRPTGTELGRSGTSILSPTSLSAGGAAYRVDLREADTTLVEIRDNDQLSLNDGFVRVGTWDDAERSFHRFSRKLARYASKN